MTSSSNYARAMLGRRPDAPGVEAFGHVDVAAAGRDQLHEVVASVVNMTVGKTEIEFHPDDLAADDEVLVAPLSGFDDWFQPQAPWSLQRAITAIRASGRPDTLTAKGITDGEWTFYSIRSIVDGRDAVIVRTQSPTWGLKSYSKIITKLVGKELRLVTEPLVAFDHGADVLVLGDRVYVLKPRPVERLFIDADAVKRRAPETAQAFNDQLKATLTDKTIIAAERICSHNANIARRIERLIRDGDLSRVTAAKVRAALPDAGLSKDAFGASGPIRASSDHLATVLVDIAADLYYQPRFSDASRRVAAYRNVRRS